MKNPYRYLVATAVFLLVLATEIFLAIQLMPAVSNKEFHDFMLLSMGFAFVPFLLVLLVAAAMLGIFILIAYGFAAASMLRPKVTIGEIAARKALEKHP